MQTKGEPMVIVFKKEDVSYKQEFSSNVKVTVEFESCHADTICEQFLVFMTACGFAEKNIINYFSEISEEI